MTKKLKKQVPIMEGIFTFPSKGPRFIASRCKKCGTFYFPATFRCHNSNCQSDDVEQTYLSRIGKLWSYTIEYYPLPPPYKTIGEFKPFGIGEVEFPEKVRVAGIIIGVDDPEKDLKFGMDMELVLDVLYEDEQGNDVIGWKFKLVNK